MLGTDQPMIIYKDKALQAILVNYLGSYKQVCPRIKSQQTRVIGELEGWWVTQKLANDNPKNRSRQPPIFHGTISILESSKPMTLPENN